MAERSKRLLGTMALLVGLSLVGCADQEESLIALNSPAWDEEGNCVVDPSSTTFLALGLLDVSQHTPYMLPVTVQNQLLSQDPSSSSNGIDNGEMQLRSADVTLSMAQTPEIIDALEARDPGLVDFNQPLPTVSLAPGAVQGVLIEVVNRAAAEELDVQLAALEPGSRPILNVEVVFNARRTGNAVGGVGDVQARAYGFPIQICSGCLLSCATCDGGQCPVNATGVVGGVCGNAQDLHYAPNGCANPLDPESGG